MKQILPWLLLGVGLFVGFVVGAISSLFFLNKIAATHLGGSALSEGVGTKSVLQQLRLGRTNEAIEHLEMELDGVIITGSISMEERPSGKESGLLRTVLQGIAKYRQQYPRTNELAGVREALDDALTSVVPRSETQKEKRQAP